MNVTGDPDVREAERVVINPVLSRTKGLDEAEEACLSIPGVSGLVQRAAKVWLTAYSLDGQEIADELDGLTARVVQHETDHLDGRLFIDRLSPTSAMAVRESLREFELQFAGQRQLGQIPHDDQIAARLAELETMRA